MSRFVRLWVVLVLIAGSVIQVAPVSAQPARTVLIETTDIRTGEPITSACYVFVDYSQEGCDENGDGVITYQGMPAAEFIVTQTRRAPGYLPMGDFPVTIHENSDGMIIKVQLARADGVNRGPFDIAIAPFNELTNDPVGGGCFILHGGSLEGCDENNDGRVTFDGVAAGTYLLSQTVASPGYLLRSGSWIVVSDDGLIRVAVAPRVPEPQTSRELPDVSIVTRASDGTLLKGACYIIINASIEGCDENGDGQVDYRDVQPGTWTVTQTLAPGNYDPVDDFEITITPEIRQSFTVNQAGSGPDSTIVSLVVIDATTGNRIFATDACFIVLGGSIEGCDENEDGQVDYLGIQPGRYAVEITSAPRGYLPYDVPLDIEVLATGSQQFVYIPFVPR